MLSYVDLLRCRWRTEAVKSVASPTERVNVARQPENGFGLG